jgi:hypothetical protein
MGGTGLMDEQREKAKIKGGGPDKHRKVGMGVEEKV